MQRLQHHKKERDYYQATLNMLKMELIDNRFLQVDESHRQIKIRQNQVDEFEAEVADRIGGLFTQALRQSLRQSLGKSIAPAKEMLPQSPDLSIDRLTEEQRGKAQRQRRPFQENPLATTITRLKGV